MPHACNAKVAVRVGASATDVKAAYMLNSNARNIFKIKLTYMTSNFKGEHSGEKT